MSSQGSSRGFKVQNLDRLFHWYKVPEVNPGVPESYFSYMDMNGGYWTVPLLFIGLFVLVSRRKNKDLVLISYLITLYVLIHLDIIGMSRTERFLEMEARVFYPIIAIGLVSLTSFFRMPKDMRIKAKYGLALLFIILAVFFNARPAYSQFSTAYGGLGRITPYQIEAGEWIKDNTPEESYFMLNGIIPQLYAKNKWFMVIAQRPVIYDKNMITSPEKVTYNYTEYVVMDYSDITLIGTQGEAFVQQMQEWEQENLIDANATKIYDKYMVKVFRLE